MRNGDDWLAYDRHFRFDQQACVENWATIRIYLKERYAHKTVRANISVRKKFQRGNGNITCYYYNTPGRTCYRGSECTKMHACLR